MKHLFAILVLLSLPQVSHAGMIINIVEVAGGVQVTSVDGGSLNLTGWVWANEYVSTNLLGPDHGVVFISGRGGNLDGYYRPNSEITGDAFLGTGPIRSGAGIVTDTGSPIGFMRSDYNPGTNTFLGVPLGYVTGSALASASASFGGTLADLGLVVGSYTWIWNADTPNEDFITVNVVGQPSSVPEPASTLVLLSIGLAGVGAARRWRR